MVWYYSGVGGHPSSDKALLWSRMDQGACNRSPSGDNSRHNHRSSGTHWTRVSGISIQRIDPGDLKSTFLDRVSIPPGILVTAS